MTKRFQMLTVFVAVLIIPSLIFAASSHKVSAAQVIFQDDNQVIVPLTITNMENLAALDIPLQFSEGVTLKEVDFENTRVSYFDLKVYNIDNDANTVVIGLMPQMTPVAKPDLQAGTGVIANLVFVIDDPSLKELVVEPTVLSNPAHHLMFVYHEFDSQNRPLIRAVSYESTTPAMGTRTVTNGQSMERVEFETITASLVSLPKNFALKQNYPNPFNPSTAISFALPEAAHITLTIYNVLGQEVRVWDETRSAGEHTIRWDADANASGVYFYRLITDNFSETKKMMLLK